MSIFVCELAAESEMIAPHEILHWLIRQVSDKHTCDSLRMSLTTMSLYEMSRKCVVFTSMPSLLEKGLMMTMVLSRLSSAWYGSRLSTLIGASTTIRDMPAACKQWVKSADDTWHTEHFGLTREYSP